ncbi:hypothetical protein [Sphingobacterium faecale]|uniref:DUF3800 domain-containing protein n=1 Tax=Sphingobacterium faecale TaxID=2803775 RepID=A0ABS1R8C3_9SPHI|nr:hypothetical protein [Sphingobacterium faecale]MBL1410976.1 hypothetical protein [Sphingobacterium faecale]
MAERTTYLKSKVLHHVMERLYIQLPEMMCELAPEGWNNSPYHFPFELMEQEREILYSSYEITARAFEQQFGRCPRKYLEDAADTMDLIFKTNPYRDNVSEMAYLIEFALAQLTQQGLLFKTNDPAHYYIIDELDIAEQSYILGMELTLPEMNFHTIASLSPARHELLFHLDLSLLYAHILEIFAQINYDWRYYNEALKLEWIGWQVAKIVNRTDGEKSHNSLWAKLSESIRSITRAQPPNEIIAYIGTHDRLPIGYPPSMEDLEHIAKLI